MKLFLSVVTIVLALMCASSCKKENDPVISPIDSIPSPPENAVDSEMIYKTGDYYAFGDSQTSGGNGSGTAPYSDGVYLLPQYRWVNLFATSANRNLNLINLAVGSTRLSWTPSYPFIQSIFNRTGYLDKGWQGVVTVMAGWNNMCALHMEDSAGMLNALRMAHQAMIARLLVDSWGGVTSFGLADNGGSGAYNWRTTGTAGGIAINSVNSRSINPFYTGSLQSYRATTSLKKGQYASFTLRSKKAVAVFYETSPGGGGFNVAVNGTTVYTGTTLFIAGCNVNDVYPGVVWIENLPDSARITVTGKDAGTINLLGFGILESSGSTISNKQILYGSTSGNLTARDSSSLRAMADIAQQAVASFSTAYPIYYVNAYNSTWNQVTDSDPKDPAHFTPIGNIHIKNAFNMPVKLKQNYHSDNVIVLPVE